MNMTHALLGHVKMVQLVSTMVAQTTSASAHLVMKERTVKKILTIAFMTMEEENAHPQQDALI